jgi:adenosylcobinamide-GDP ribazoletransferase
LEQIKLFLLALQFFTRVPVTGRLAHWVGYSPERLSRATRYFPLVGVLVALTIAVVFALCALVLPQILAVIACLAFGVWLTGAFHEDGWIDFCDAFGGQRSREKTLEIMQDSRIGSYGAIALVLLMATKIETLAALDASWVGVSLLAAHTVSRLCAVGIMLSLPYAKPQDDSKSKPIASGVTLFDGLIALMITAATFAACVVLTADPKPFFAGLVLSILGSLYLRRMMRKRLQGYTGDGLGATQQLAEALFYVGLVALMSMNDVFEATIDPSS